MRSVLPEKVEAGRLAGRGLYGAFALYGPCGRDLKIVASAGEDVGGWEHVSISTPGRPPNWQEMCFVKDLFWNADECVIQFHPPASAYVNNHPNCLHLWKPPYATPLPPEELVGIKASGELSPRAARLLHRFR